MGWLDVLRFRARAIRRTRLEQNFDDELQFHVDQLTEQHLARGLTSEEAVRAARREFGDATYMKEDLRAVNWVHLVDAFRQDLRHGVRLLVRNPGFAAAAISSVALSIAVTTAVFTLVYGIVLKPLPYPDPHRLMNLWTNASRLGLPRGFVGSADYRDWTQQSQSFESLALVRHIGNFNLSAGSEPERLQGARVTASFFSVLGIRPVIGRPFRTDEEVSGRESVVILSDGLWTRRFGRDPAVVGRTIVLNSQAHEVVGVMPPGFAFPTREFELWLPLTFDIDDYRTRSNFSFLGIGRLKREVTLQQAQSELDAISARLAQQHPSNRDISGVVEPMHAGLVRDVRRPLLILLAAVATLLLIGCASLANLLIARAIARSGELVLRAALGAGRGRLVRQSLTELIPLLAIGGALGILSAHVFVAMATPWLPPAMPRLEAVTIGTPVLAFAVVLLLLTAILTSVWPAVQVARWDVASAIRESLRGSSTTLRGAWMRDALVVVQVSVAVLLTVAAVLLTRSFINLKRIDPGFRAEGVATMQLAIPRAKYPGGAQVAVLCRDMVDRVRQLPGVRAAAMVNRLPLGGVGQINRVELEGSALADNRMTVDSRSVTPDYFVTMGVPLLEGRFLTDADTADGPAVGIVDDRFARAAWPNQRAIGRRFRISGGDLPWVTVIGVVGHIRHESLATDPRPQVYWSHLQRPQDRMALVVRTDGDPSAVVRPVIAQIRAVDSEQAVYDVRPMTEVLARATGQERLTAAVLGAFAVVSLLMSAIGVYGVVSYGVRLRSREFSLRMALGAARRDVLLIVLRRGARLVGCGLAAGVLSALAFSRVLSGLLHNVSSTDVVTFAAAVAALALVALAAMIVPARRALSADATTVLRTE